MSDFQLRRKWTFRAYDQQVVFIKNKVEKTSHVLMKAFLWALYLPLYPDLLVETRIGVRYKPDVVALDAWQEPLFWGESGQVGADKLAKILRRYAATHFAFAKWDTNTTQFEAQIEAALSRSRRKAPIDVFVFPADSAERFIDQSGTITLTFEDVPFRRFEPLEM